MEDYKRLRHYNLAELTKPEVTETDKPDDQVDGESGKEPAIKDEEQSSDEKENNEVSVKLENVKAEEPEGQSDVIETEGETTSKLGETPT